MFNSVLGTTITPTSLFACLGAAIVLGILTSIVFMYKSRHSASFALTLALLPMTVAIVIMLVNGNIGTGIAVAGAFTLVRFRSVPGTAREISAIFTAMAIGLALGMGYIAVAVIFFIITAAFTLLLTAINFGSASKNEKRLKITIPESFNYEGLFDEIFEKYNVDCRLETIKTTNMGTLFELSYDATFRSGAVPKAFIDELRTRNENLNITVGGFNERESL